MTSLTVDLDDSAAERLRAQAEEEGVTVAELARRLLTEAASGDPFEFFNAGSSETLRGATVDDHLNQHRFGRA